MIAAALILGTVVCILLAVRSAPIALAVSPFISVALALFSGFRGSIAGVAASPLVFLITLVAIWLFRPHPEAERWPEWAAKWILIGFVCLVAIWGSGPWGMLLVIAFFALLLRSVRLSRDAVAADAIATIGSAMRQNLPLPGALAAAAEGRTDKRASIFRKIAVNLGRGDSLAEALRRGFRACPGHALGAITTAERIGQLPAAISSLEQDLARKCREAGRVPRFHPGYPVAVLFIALTGVSIILAFIVPTYQAVFANSGAELPGPTRALWAPTLAGRLVLPLLAGLCLLAAAVSIWASFRSRRPGRPRPLSRIGDFVKWHLPVFHWFERSYSLLHTVELLRLSLKAGCTIDQAIAATLELDVNSRFRKRVARWLRRVRRGEDVSVAAGKSRLGRPLAWAFDQRVNPGNAPAALETLETFYRSNYSYMANLVKTVSWPCMVIAVGGLVGYVAYAMFLPIVSMHKIYLQIAVP